MLKKRKNNSQLPDEAPSLKGSRASRKLIVPRLSRKHRLSKGASIADDVPRITNETVEQHRKEVIKGGRKYTYPIINTPRRIVGLSLVIALIALIVFSTYTMVQIYRYKNHSDFIYNVAKVVPLPVARVGGQFVAYEDYLFELRRYVHYFQTQQGVDFHSEEGKQELKNQQQRSLQRVVDNAYIQKVARQRNITVTAEEVDIEISLLRQQNKLGSSEEDLEDVLRLYWGWTLADYRESVAIELLRQKVVAALDTQSFDLAGSIIKQLREGRSFEELAAEHSADIASAQNGGEYGFLLDLEGQNEDPRVLNAVFKTEVGEVTEVINTGYALEIVRVLSDEGNGKRKAAHISIPFADIGQQINNLREEQPARVYINFD